MLKYLSRFIYAIIKEIYYEKNIAIMIISIFLLSSSTVYAADVSEKWKINIGDITDCSPAIGADGTIYIGGRDTYLYSINPNGSLKWKFKTGNIVHSSPAIGPDGTIYFGSLDKYIYALNPNGDLK